MVERKKVILLVNIWKKVGGLETVNSDVVHAFLALGWQVTVMSVFGKDDLLESDGYELINLSPKKDLFYNFWKQHLWQRLTARKIHQRLAKGDLLIFGHSHLLSVLDYLPKNFEYNRWCWVYGLEVWGEQALRWIPYLNQLDRVVSISVFTSRQLIINGLNCTVSVVPCAVDVETFIPTSTPDKIRKNEVLICGRMSKNEKYKGHEMLFKSINIAEKLYGHSITVRVIGSGDDEPRLKKISEELGLADKVEFCGRVSFNQLIEAYQHCGVFCMPSYVEEKEIGYWTGEGFGIVYIEAAACGRPVLASTDGGAPETIIDGVSGLLVNPKSPESIGSSIAEILSNPVMSDEFGKQGRNLTETLFPKEKFKVNIQKLLTT